MKRYSILTVLLTVFHCIITLSTYYLINLVVNSYVQVPGQCIINDNFTVVSIVKNTFKE